MTCWMTSQTAQIRICWYGDVLYSPIQTTGYYVKSPNIKSQARHKGIKLNSRATWVLLMEDRAVSISQKITSDHTLPIYSIDFLRLAGMLTAATPENVPKPALWIGRARMHYMEAAASWRVTDQLFVCCREHNNGTPLSKEELARWGKEVIIQAFLNTGHEVPRFIYIQTF